MVCIAGALRFPDPETPRLSEHGYCSRRGGGCANELGQALRHHINGRQHATKGRLAVNNGVYSQLTSKFEVEYERGRKNLISQEVSYAVYPRFLSSYAQQ